MRARPTSVAAAPSTCGGTCQTTGSGLRVNCTDTYSAGTNANRYYLAPTSEVDPWTGVWNPVGSYFDRGDPDVGPPSNQDGIRSLTSGTTGVFTDLVRNRVTLREQDLLVPGRLFHCMHIVVRGEDGDLHFDNTGHRQMTATFGGTTWSFANSGVPFTQGTVLAEWAGASIASARNGEDDGHFLVAVKVTQLGGQSQHYEYAVHNLDNARGGATLRIPLCSSTSLTNVGVRDPNGNPLDDWTWSRAGEELVFAASANNPLNWNNIYNFWFDCDAAPVAGVVAIDQARPGPGALTVSVNAQVPAGNAIVSVLGAGCGAPLPALTANGLPVIPSPSFGLQLTATPGAALFLFYSFGGANVPMTPGCIQFLDPQSFGVFGYLVADGAGVATAPVPIPDVPALDGLSLFWQAAQAVSGGPVLGFLTLSNGLLTRIGCH